MRLAFAAAALAALALPGAAMAEEKSYPKGEAELAKMLEGRVAGEPVRCVPTSSLGQSTVIDKTAIVYRVGSKLYVNRPRGGADQLSDDEILVTKVYGSQLCNIDKIDLVDRTSQMWSGFVVLGDFVPYTKVKATR
jgi:hypothetical protein